MTMAEEMVGVGGTVVHELPTELLVEIMQRYGRGSIGQP